MKLTHKAVENVMMLDKEELVSDGYWPSQAEIDGYESSPSDGAYSQRVEHDDDENDER